MAIEGLGMVQFRVSPELDAPEVANGDEQSRGKKCAPAEAGAK
jgi:hypothetical protein